VLIVVDKINNASGREISYNILMFEICARQNLIDNVNVLVVE